MNIDLLIQSAKNNVSEIVLNSKAEPRSVLARYTAATAVNFTDWLGKTTPWVRHEDSYRALVDNLRCEAEHDHVGMLLEFAKLSKSSPEKEDYELVSDDVSKIRALFKDSTLSGIRGLALSAFLENTSEIFIPDLAQKAKSLGCSNFTYTDVHGEADKEHSEAFVNALKSEVTMGYENPENLITEVFETSLNLLRRVYS